jgi:two-component system NtrC family sensor kinase
MEPFALSEPLSHALRLLETRLDREGVCINLDISADLPRIWGGSDQIEQVFLNVLVNAWHAMPDGGVVTLTARAIDKQWVRLSFRDTGIGMSAEDLGKAFEPFYSTKGEKGTGLGLAICKQIIESQQGHMSLESTLGVGTTVTIDLLQAAART